VELLRSSEGGGQTERFIAQFLCNQNSKAPPSMGSLWKRKRKTACSAFLVLHGRRQKKKGQPIGHGKEAVFFVGGFWGGGFFVGGVVHEGLTRKKETRCTRKSSGQRVTRDTTTSLPETVSKGGGMVVVVQARRGSLRRQGGDR